MSLWTEGLNELKRTSLPRNRCSQTWTEAQFTSFVKSQLRAASRKWKPINEVFKEARRERGIYECNKCHQWVPLKVSLNGKKINNVFVDHVNPIVDPEQGFVSWDEFINGLFCERENLQVLCGQCHDEKSLEERKIATERRRQEKEAINEQVI